MLPRRVFGEWPPLVAVLLLPHAAKLPPHPEEQAGTCPGAGASSEAEIKTTGEKYQSKERVHIHSNALEGPPASLTVFDTLSQACLTRA